MRINNRGAASILVILIIVVLATFGGIALTAGWTNKQLSIKAAQFKVDYYTLDSAAEEIVAETDSLLYLAAEKTDFYLNGLSNVNDVSVLTKATRFESLFSNDAESAQSLALKNKKIYEIYKRIYYYECATRLERFADEKGIEINYTNGFEKANDFLKPANKIPESGDLTISFTVSQEGVSAQKSLDVEIAIISPEIYAEVLNEETWRTNFAVSQKEEVRRFEIVSWKLRQKPIEYAGENPKFG